MKFEEALSLMREGKKVKLYNRFYRIDEQSDLVYLSSDGDYWDTVFISGWDILSEDWEILDDNK